MKTIGLYILLSFLMGCVFDAGDDAATDAEVASTIDARVNPIDAAMRDATVVDTAPATSCVGAYIEKVYVPLEGTCGAINLGELAFSISDARQLTSTIPLVSGAVDATCAVEVWQTAPYGVCLEQIHHEFAPPQQDANGRWISEVAVRLELYCPDSGFGCWETYWGEGEVTP